MREDVKEIDFKVVVDGVSSMTGLVIVFSTVKASLLIFRHYLYICFNKQSKT